VSSLYKLARSHRCAQAYNLGPLLSFVQKHKFWGQVNADSVTTDVVCKGYRSHAPHISRFRVYDDSLLPYRLPNSLLSMLCLADVSLNKAVNIWLTNDMLRAFTVYVRSILEYCSVVWNPFLLKGITAIEKVQRRFIKRLFSMSGLAYHQRLVKLGLESLELRRMRADLVFAYKIIWPRWEGASLMSIVRTSSRYAPVTHDDDKLYSKYTAKYNCLTIE